MRCNVTPRTSSRKGAYHDDSAIPPLLLRSLEFVRIAVGGSASFAGRIPDVTASSGASQGGRGTAGEWKRGPEAFFGDLTSKAVEGGRRSSRPISGRIPN